MTEKYIEAVQRNNQIKSHKSAQACYYSDLSALYCIILFLIRNYGIKHLPYRVTNDYIRLTVKGCG